MRPEIFKAYDIRGLVPEELDAAGAGAIGRAIARYLGAPGSVVVGRDMRESVLELRAALVAGLRSGLLFAASSESTAGHVLRDDRHFE